jgi:isoquinoline 1-oxidoreductase
MRDLEPDRYELRSAPLWSFEIDRREALKVIGGGIAVFVLFDPRAFSQEAPESGGRRRRGGDQPRDIGAWLSIADDGAITVFTGKVEVGQDIRTSLAQTVADELGVAVGAIRLVMGETALVPFDQGTFGSRTTPMMASWLRQVAAAARDLLKHLIARDWGVETASLVVEGGRIRHEGSGRSAGFGDIARGKNLAHAVVGAVEVKPPSRWTVAGASVPRVTGRAIVTGLHRFPSDVTRAGLLHGRILRPPAIGAKLTAADAAKAEAAGAIVVRDGDFVGVAARTPHLAAEALAEIHAEWAPTEQPAGGALFDTLRQRTGDDGRRPVHVAGSLEEGLRGADHRFAATYTTAYVAHAPLEPRAAVAEWEGDRLKVWTGTQRPFGVRAELARALGIPETAVTVNMPDTGGGFGGKHTGEVAVEAARLARKAGKPVKVVWSREEEFNWAYFRPAALIDIKSGVRKSGDLVAWEFHDFNAGAAGIRTPYEVSHQRIEFHESRSPLRQGSYRALAATANVFARETHMDELARALGLDPVELRLRNLRDDRLRAVLSAAAERFGWRSRTPRADTRPAGRSLTGHGIACGTEKGSVVATCAEVRVLDKEVELVRLVTAFECGAIVNPANLKSQVEGAVIMGIGGALFEAIEFDRGRILNGRFSGYRVPRFDDVPALETVLIDRKDLPSAGAGETPIIAVAPAIGNAIFDATGVRLRSLPLIPRGRVG